MRNKHRGPCYLCGKTVEPGTGHFERHQGGWRVKHANIPGDGRVTCEMALNQTKWMADLAQKAERTTRGWPKWKRESMGLT